jgi:hypothetical protein
LNLGQAGRKLNTLAQTRNREALLAAWVEQLGWVKPFLSNTSPQSCCKNWLCC